MCLQQTRLHQAGTAHTNGTHGEVEQAEPPCMGLPTALQHLHIDKVWSVHGEALQPNVSRVLI